MTKNLSEILAGASLGAFVGVLLGMSASPVVGTVLGAIAAMLATFLGLATGSGDNEHPHRRFGPPPLLRLISFCLFALVAVVVAVYVRNADLLSPGFDAQAKHWESLGFDRAQARELVAYVQLGLVPKNWIIPSGPDEKAGAKGMRPKTALGTVLFSTPSEVCASLSPDRYAKGELTSAFALAGGRWASLAESVKSLPASQQGEILTATWKLVCIEQ